jgi:hypothetical protein
LGLREHSVMMTPVAVDSRVRLSRQGLRFRETVTLPKMHIKRGFRPENIRGIIQKNSVPTGSAE